MKFAKIFIGAIFAAMLFVTPAAAQKSVWLGGKKIPLPHGKTGWFYMGEFYTAKKNAPLSAFRGKGLCVLD